jgi:two-component system sensor histidine kinase HupT/HoxJ
MLLLQQALLNILINAEHAIMSGGEPGRINTSIAAVNGGDVVRLTIEDSGPGIAPEVLPRIFDPFFTTKDVGVGTGLGLAITYGIVQEHGGTILASNTPGGGARFTIDFPALPSISAGRRTELTKKVRAV